MKKLPIQKGGYGSGRKKTKFDKITDEKVKNALINNGASYFVLREVKNILDENGNNLENLKMALNEIGYSSKKINKIINEI